MKSAISFAAALSLILLLAAAGTWLYLRHAASGFGARATPTAIEASLAHHAQQAAMPATARDRPNPLTASPEVMHEAMAHYADHCAVCHANNGSGDTMLGNGMYPRPPDMRLAATQARTDGELFSIIENGIRLSGMPAFDSATPTPASETDSWKLVLFLRHLPRLTPEELAAMGDLNPKSPDELEEDKQEADFLNGTNVTPSSPSKKAHSH